MNQSTQTNNQLFYYNPKENNSIKKFCQKLSELISNNTASNQSLVLLCIGSDRATGDCLGPIIGYKLSQMKYKHLDIYGTLENPVHAKNLSNTVNTIKKKHKNPFIVAIDASLGKGSHIGFVTLGNGSLSPGIGVNKDLPAVGNIFITGIVNMSGELNHVLLQTTRLDVVMRLADYICLGIRYSIFNHYREYP